MRRIYPADVPSLSEDALVWRSTEHSVPPEPELSFARLQFDGDPGRGEPRGCGARRRVWRARHRPGLLAEFGLATDGDPRLGGDDVSLPVIESMRSTRRVGPNGQVVFDLVAEDTQRRNVRAGDSGEPGFDFFGGATVVLGPKGQVRYVIRKSVLDDTRIDAQRRFIKDQGKPFFGIGPGNTSLPEARLLLKLHDITRPSCVPSAGTRALMRDMTATVEGAAAQRYLVKRGGTDPCVPLLKACLNGCMEPSPNLDDSNIYDAPTEQAVSRLQTEEGASVDGITGPATWTIIGKRLRKKGSTPPLTDSTPRWSAC